MIKKILYLIGLFCIPATTNIIACECESSGDFLTVAPKTEMVALVKVIKYLDTKNRYGKPTSMELEVIQVYKGTETRKTITVWCSTGKDCRPLITQFNVGKYYVIAFNKCYEDAIEKSTDYTTSVCGVHWLDVDMKSKYALGSIGEMQKQIGLIDLEEKLKKK